MFAAPKAKLDNCKQVQGWQRGWSGTGGMFFVPVPTNIPAPFPIAGKKSPHSSSQWGFNS